MPELTYQAGFGNDFSTEGIAGALPVGRNSPQKAPLGLYAEQLSGTAFTAPRVANRRSWLYRIRPGVAHSAFKPMDAGLVRGTPFDEVPPSPDQLRWDPIPMPSAPTDFVDGLTTICGNGSINGMTGMAALIYVANKSMHGRFFYNADGEMLFVPEMNRIRLVTELGIIEVGPGEIAVVQRGIRFRVELPDGNARGYICENYGALLRPPDLGPIGANGLANQRDFLTPVAAFEDVEGDFALVVKYHGRLSLAAIDHSPLDVVAWHGNYAPYKYDLGRFNTVNTVSFDHPDPSIFTVLTSPTDTPGTANVDFVIFPPRWMVAENTFRPPYYHRNIMSEYMGLVSGSYDAKSEGFLPGGGSLHNCMSGHGPDAETFEAATNAKLEPHYQGDTLAFMFETRYALVPTKFAMETPALQKDYLDCWKGLQKHFGN